MFLNSNETKQMYEKDATFRTSTLNLQLVSVLLGCNEHPCFLVCVCVLHRTKDAFVQARGCSVSSTNTFLHVFSCMFMCCCPHVCFLTHCLLREA